jgi:SAM-dependent methyltransferase
MPYIHSLPPSVAFTGKGLLGYTFGPLSQKDLDVYYVEVEKGHDVFMISKRIVRVYYILSGRGSFTIDGQKYDVSSGMLVEVPPKVEYCYSGKMTLIVLSRPRWFSGNDTFTKWNPDVVGREADFVPDGKSWLRRLVRFKVLGKTPMNVYLRLNRRIWNTFPSSVTAMNLICLYGKFLHTLVRMQSVRSQAFSTFFLRNRPELDLIVRLIESKRRGDTLRVAVLGCSTGPEAYSVAWRIRSARPDLKLILYAVDISRQAVEFAERGVYSVDSSQLGPTRVLEHMTPAEIDELFDRNGDVVSIKSWIREGIKWQIGDVGVPHVLEPLGLQDIVVANNFLCHMDASEADSCLRNIARSVSPQGYLFVSGIDLDVRTQVARDLGWQPVEELIEEIHEADAGMRSDWPFHYGGLEPLNKMRRDWRVRYASVFELGSSSIPSSDGAVQDETLQRLTQQT